MFLSFKRDTGAHSYHSAPAGSYSPAGWCLADRGCTQQIPLPPASTIMQLCTAPLGKKEKLGKIKASIFYHGFVVKGDHSIEMRVDDLTQFENLYLRCFPANEHSGKRALTSILKDRKRHKVLASSQRAHHSPSKQDVMSIS